MGDMELNKNFDIQNAQLRKCLANQKHIRIPDGVTIVREGAFSLCSLAETIEFPDSVRILVMGWGNREFINCSHLRTIKLGKNVEQYNLKIPKGIEVVFPRRVRDFLQ